MLLHVPDVAWARLTLRQLVVHGEVKTRQRVLLARMGLHPGDTVDYGVLASAEQRLQESQLFTDVLVTIEMPRAEAAQRMYVELADTPVDVHVWLKEKQSWFVAPLGSFGSGDYAAGVAYGESNLGGHDVQLVSAAQLGQSRSFVFAGYRDPLIIGAPLSWAVAGLYRSEQVRFFAEHRRVMQVPTLIFGGEAELGWVLSPHVRASLGFSGRQQRVAPAEASDPTAPLPPYNSREGRIFLLVFQALYDDTTAPVGLRRGVRLLLKNEASDQFWGSQFDYSKFEGRVEFYWKIRWNYPSLILKSVVDFPTSSRGVPITEMLRVGGDNLRGYLVNEFHGDTLVSAQAEDQVIVAHGVRVPMTGLHFNLALAAFMDAATLLERHPGGTASETPTQARPKLKDVHTSVGGGFRIIVPGVAIPAIKGDLGYGIDVRSFAISVSVAGAT